MHKHFFAGCQIFNICENSDSSRHALHVLESLFKRIIKLWMYFQVDGHAVFLELNLKFNQTYLNLTYHWLTTMANTGACPKGSGVLHIQKYDHNFPTMPAIPVADGSKGGRGCIVSRKSTDCMASWHVLLVTDRTSSWAALASVFPNQLISHYWFFILFPRWWYFLNKGGYFNTILMTL